MKVVVGGGGGDDCDVCDTPNEHYITHTNISAHF